MASTQTGRVGTFPEEGIKAPVKVATNAAITLSGEQTVNSVAVTAGDRVLVKDQVDASENGIYVVSTLTWSRATDWNKGNDVASGVLVFDNNADAIYKASFTGDFVAGTTEVTMTPIAFFEADPAEIAAIYANLAEILQADDNAAAALVSETAALVSETNAAAHETAALNARNAAKGGKWEFATGGGTPATGEITYDDDDPTATTEIKIHGTDGDSNDVGGWLDEWLQVVGINNGFLTIRPLATNNIAHIFKVTNVVEAAGVYTLTVIYAAGSGAFADTTGVGAMFSKAGITGVPAGIRQTFSLSTSIASTAAGEIRYNNATLASVTSVAIHDTDSYGNDIAGGYAYQMTTNGIRSGILIIQPADTLYSDVHVFNVTGITLSASKTYYSVDNVEGSAIWADGVDLSTLFIPYAKSSHQGRYVYNSLTTAGFPGNGIFRFNNADPALATAIYIPYTDGSDSDLSDFLASWDDSTSTNKGILAITDRTDGPTDVFNVTAVADNTTYFTVTVSAISNNITYSTALSDFNYGFDFYRTGDAGDVTSVNGYTGVVVLDPDDLDDTATTNKFATAAQLAKVDNLTVTGAINLDADTAKLAGIESGATADQTGAEIKALYEAEADTNAFDDAAVSKLAGIEALADVTDATNVTAAGALMDSEVGSLSGIKTLTVPDNTTISTFGATLVDDTTASGARSTLGLGSLATKSTVNNSDWSGTDLSVANGGTGSSTAANARTALGLAIGTNVQAYSAILAGMEQSFTTALKSKLDAIEASATADQTGAEIKALYEAEADTNAFDDAAVSKLAGIESGATADQTGAEIKVAYEAEADTNAFTDAEKTKLSTALVAANVLDEDDFVSDSATYPPSQQSVAAYIAANASSGNGMKYAYIDQTSVGVSDLTGEFFPTQAEAIAGATGTRWATINGVFSALIPGDSVCITLKGDASYPHVVTADLDCPSNSIIIITGVNGTQANNIIDMDTYTLTTAANVSLMFWSVTLDLTAGTGDFILTNGSDSLQPIGGAILKISLADCDIDWGRGGNNFITGDRSFVILHTRFSTWDNVGAGRPSVCSVHNIYKEENNTYVGQWKRPNKFSDFTDYGTTNVN